MAGWGVVIEFVNSGIGHTSSSEGGQGDSEMLYLVNVKY